MATRGELVQLTLGSIARTMREAVGSGNYRHYTTLAHKPWFQELHSMANDTIPYPATHDPFFPWRRGSREGVGRP
jgi:hypothetical protein